MERTALNDLKQWLQSSSRMPLVVRGARQVGKTWLVRELARSSNLKLIEINFELHPDKKALFEVNEPQQVLSALEINLGQSIDAHQSLLFLDEIQAFPEMLAKLRWFKEIMPELPVVVAGSLLEFVLDEHSFAMPVGRISYYHLEPLSFEEFLHAQNPPLLALLQNYQWELLPNHIHQQALDHLKTYTLIGGLPAAVSSWLTDASWVTVQRIHHDILTTYRDDFARYKGRYDMALFDDTFNYVSANIGNKIVYSHINQHAQVAALTQIMNLLTKARIIHTVQASAGNGIPLGAEINSKHKKAIMLDTGLANSMLGINAQDFISDESLATIHKGAIAEQLVGQLLRTIEPSYVEPTLYYWLRNAPGSNAEVDYLIQHGSHIIPIEVKAGTRGSMQSLHRLMKLKGYMRAVRFSTNPPSQMQVNTQLSSGENVQYELLTLPIYMVGQLKRLLV